MLSVYSIYLCICLFLDSVSIFLYRVKDCLYFIFREACYVILSVLYREVGKDYKLFLERIGNSGRVKNLCVYVGNYAGKYYLKVDISFIGNVKPEVLDVILEEVDKSRRISDKSKVYTVRIFLTRNFCFNIISGEDSILREIYEILDIGDSTECLNDYLIEVKRTHLVNILSIYTYIFDFCEKYRK